jgi:hypothetical protein
MALTIYRRNDARIILKKTIYFFHYLNNKDNINDIETWQSDIFKNRALLSRIGLNESYRAIFKTAEKCCEKADINKKRILSQVKAVENMFSIKKFAEPF